jgi:ribosome biogenesis GTPase A
MSSSMRNMQLMYKGGDKFMMQAVTKVNGLRNRDMVLQMVPAFAPDSAGAHKSIARWLQEARVRVRVYSHADLLSDRALEHVVRRAEEEDPSLAIVCVDLRTADTAKPKLLNPILNLLLGGLKETNSTHCLICGLPNSGKSSIVHPLTKTAIREIKAKKDYHFAKISSKAGRTVAVKVHRLISKLEFFIYDSPGLLPRELSDQGLIEAIISGALPASANIPASVWDTDAVLTHALQGLNLHARVSGAPPGYVGILGLPGPTEDPALLLSYYKESEINPDRKNIKTPNYKLTESFLSQLRKGRLGQLLLASGEGRACLLADSEAAQAAPPVPPVPIQLQTAPRKEDLFNRNSLIVYMNKRAQQLCNVHKDSVAKESESKAEKKAARREEKTGWGDAAM